MNGDDEVDDDDLLIAPNETVCEACRLVRNKYLTECGSCLGPSVHEKEVVW